MLKAKLNDGEQKTSITSTSGRSDLNITGRLNEEIILASKEQADVVATDIFH